MTPRDRAERAQKVAQIRDAISEALWPIVELAAAWGSSDSDSAAARAEDAMDEMYDAVIAAWDASGCRPPRNEQTDATVAETPVSVELLVDAATRKPRAM